jgi:hypothetical protein
MMKKLLVVALLGLTACGSQLVNFLEDEYVPSNEVRDAGSDASSDASNDSSLPPFGLHPFRLDAGNDGSSSVDAGLDAATVVADSGVDDSGSNDDGGFCSSCTCINLCDDNLNCCQTQCEQDSGSSYTECISQCESEHDICVRGCKSS